MSEKFLDITSNRQTQMIVLWQGMESIRWRFTSTFGVGAIVALFLSIDQLNHEKTIVALILLFSISIASIICQLRLYGVLVSLWEKTILLQKLELETLKNLDLLPSISSEDERAFYFPQPLPSKIRLVSITGTSCSVFAFLAALAIYLSMRTFSTSILWSLLISGMFLLIVSIAVTIGLHRSVKFHS